MRLAKEVERYSARRESLEQERMRDDGGTVEAIGNSDPSVEARRQHRSTQYGFAEYSQVGRDEDGEREQQEHLRPSRQSPALGRRDVLGLQSANLLALIDNLRS